MFTGLEMRLGSTLALDGTDISFVLSMLPPDTRLGQPALSEFLDTHTV